MKGQSDSIVVKGVLILVVATIAGYMFGPAIQGWILANTTGSTGVTWLNLTVMPIIIGVTVLLLLVYNAISKKH